MTIPAFPPRSWLALCGLAAAFSLNGWAYAADAAPAQSAAALMEPIKALIGDAECDHPTQCQVVGVGAKACGGPSGFLAWSVKNTDQPALLAAVQAQAAAEKEENKTNGRASDCMLNPAPGATCRPRASDGKKVCQLGQGGVRRVD